MSYRDTHNIIFQQKSMKRSLYSLDFSHIELGLPVGGGVGALFNWRRWKLVSEGGIGVY